MTPLASIIAGQPASLTSDREPGPLPQRLRRLSEAVRERAGELDHRVDLYVSAKGRCPAALEDTVLRVARELLGNAVKHGMDGRVVGCICVDLVSGERRTVLTVTDDGWGWGWGNEPAQGEGLQLARLLAREHGGTVRLRREDRATVATLDLPHPTSRSDRTKAQ